jgi:hypothetical protein
MILHADFGGRSTHPGVVTAFRMPTFEFIGLVINRIRKKLVRPALAALITAIIVFGITSMATKSVPGRLYDPKPGAKTVGQFYKNIQVLKEMPILELYPTMESYSLSLGVSCEYCHVINAYDKDTKGTKLAARRMIRLQMEINKDQFGGSLLITCYSCHRGRVAVPLE